jgi:uncharacterized membrane protein
MKPQLRKLTLACTPAVAILVACQDPGEPADSSEEIASAKAAAFAELIALPTLSGRTSEALAVNPAGTVVVGSAWERGLGATLRAVRWTLQNDGSWSIAVLPHAATATGAIARAVDAQGGGAGSDFPAISSDAVYWPAAGGFNVLSCVGETGAAEVYGITGDGQTLVGSRAFRQPGSAQPGNAAVWRPGSCVENLPFLAAGAFAGARAVNTAGTIIGGLAALTPTGDPFPARWTRVAGQWQVVQLDQRTGVVLGGNGTGDLVGRVSVVGGIRAMIWYAAGGSLQLGTLGGADSWANDINAAGEVVGLSTSSLGNTAYIWSQSTGMRQLPYKGRCCAVANAVSDVRQDGTRVVAGSNGSARAVVWVVQGASNP